MNLVPVNDTPSGLVPANMREAMELAQMMATARLVPQALQKSPADCLMVIQQAIRWQMDPFAVAQECSVIQGKLMHSGKLVAAVVNARGDLEERLAFSYTGKGDDLTITVSGKLRGEAEPRRVQVRYGNAKTQNQQWVKQPEQQLMYHAVRVWARRHTPELMLGVYSPEEFDDTPASNGYGRQEPVYHAAQPTVSTISPPTAIAPDIDPTTGEIGPRTIVHEPEESLVDWSVRFVAGVKTSISIDELHEWRANNQATLDEIRQHPKGDKLSKRIEAQFEGMAKALAPAKPAAVEDPEEVIRLIESEWNDCNTAEDINAVEARFQDRIGTLMPPDQDFLVQLKQSHIERVGP